MYLPVFQKKTTMLGCSLELMCHDANHKRFTWIPLTHKIGYKDCEPCLSEKIARNLLLQRFLCSDSNSVVVVRLGFSQIPWTAPWIKASDWMQMYRISIPLRHATFYVLFFFFYKWRGGPDNLCTVLIYIMQCILTERYRGQESQVLSLSLRSWNKTLIFTQMCFHSTTP